MVTAVQLYKIPYVSDIELFFYSCNKIQLSKIQWNPKIAELVNPTY